MSCLRGEVGEIDSGLYLPTERRRVVQGWVFLGKVRFGKSDDCQEGTREKNGQEERLRDKDNFSKLPTPFESPMGLFDLIKRISMVDHRMDFFIGGELIDI